LVGGGEEGLGVGVVGIEGQRVERAFAHRGPVAFGHGALGLVQQAVYLSLNALAQHGGSPFAGSWSEAGLRR